MSARERVAVVGAGALGLMATKQFLADGFEVTTFDSRPYVGGLWKDSGDDTISVHATTIFNTSKFRAAISDFPFPEDDDIYPTAAQLHRYLESYADHFDLRKHIHLSARVCRITRKENEWCLEAEENGTIQPYTFDRICVATGSFFNPRWPKLDGLENFSGKVIHSIEFHGSEPFKDQNVLIIGMHATAQDVTNALSESAKHVYLSHRNGLLLLPRFTENGEAFDTTMKIPMLFIQSWLDANMPSFCTWLFDNLVSGVSKKAYPDLPQKLGLLPAPSLAVSTPLFADTLYPFLESGFAEPVPAVKKVTGTNTVELTNGRELSEIDAIIYCTGYDFNIPEGLVPRPSSNADSLAYHPYPDGPGTNPHLYLNMFPMSSDPAIRNSLAFLGQSAIHYPGFVQFELSAMSLSQVWLGNKPLPPYDEMLTWHEQQIKWRSGLAKRYNAAEGGTFYPAFLPFSQQLSWLLNTSGAGITENLGGKFNGLFNWKCWKLWWNDRELYDLCTKGILSPTIFRVFEAGGRKALDREDAKRRLRRDNEVFERAVKVKQEELAKKKKA